MFDAAEVDECFSRSDEDVHEIYGMRLSPEMPEIDHLRQEVMSLNPINIPFPITKY
jgi:hypothetical protein